MGSPSIQLRVEVHAVEFEGKTPRLQVRRGHNVLPRQFSHDHRQPWQGDEHLPRDVLAVPAGQCLLHFHC